MSLNSTVLIAHQSIFLNKEGNETPANSQIYQLQGQQRNQIPRTNSLMKNFCYFTDADYEESIKIMYDESLVEWKKFQNSKINEPKKLQRNSQLAPKQNIFLSLGKEKKFSLKDIQKIRKEQEDEKQNQRNIPMAVRRKSCECNHCGKLNSKQIQLQDLPFIPKQQKKISSILAAPIRQPLRGGQKQSPPSSPQNHAKSQTNIPSASIQRKSFAAAVDKQDKSQNNQKTKVGQAKNRSELPSNISPNTSIEKQDDSIRNKRSSSRNLKWGDQVSETSIEENQNYKKRHCTVLVRKNSKFEPPMSPVNSSILGGQKKASQTKVEGVLEKSVKEKSKCMTALMNFLKKIIEKVQKEEQQKLNQETENTMNNPTEQKAAANGTFVHLEDNESNSINKNSQNFSQNVLNTQDDEDFQDSQQNNKKMGHSQLSSFNPKDFSRKRSSVGDLFKPRAMKVSSPAITDTLKLNQKSQKDVITSMETLSQFRDRYLKQYADLANKGEDKPQKKKKQVTQRSMQQQSTGSLKKEFQIGRYSTARDEQRQKRDNLIDQLMIFSENHTPLLQSPYFAEVKTEEQLFDKQYNKKNFYQKVFTTNVITEEPRNFNLAQTTRSFYNSSNNNATSSLMNVPTISTFTNLNPQSTTPPVSKQQMLSSNKKNKIIFTKNSSNQQSQQMQGPNYQAMASRRNMSQSDLFLKNIQMANKFSSYLQPMSSPKIVQSQNFLAPPLNYQYNGIQTQPPSTAPFLRNGLNTAEQNSNKNNKYINESLHSPKKPSSSSAARFGSFQSSHYVNKNESLGIDNHTTIKSFKELDLILDGPAISQQNSSKQSSLNTTQQNKHNSNHQSKIAIITAERKAMNNNKMPYISNYNNSNNNNQPSSEENTVVIQNDSGMKNSSTLKNSQSIQKTNTIATNGGATGQRKYNNSYNNASDISRKQSLKQQ